MTKYEYKVIDTVATGVPLSKGNTYAERLQNGLNRLGNEGWNVCGILSTLIVLSRPKEEKTEPSAEGF